MDECVVRDQSKKLPPGETIDFDFVDKKTWKQAIKDFWKDVKDSLKGK